MTHCSIHSLAFEKKIKKFQVVDTSSGMLNHVNVEYLIRPIIDILARDKMRGVVLHFGPVPSSPFRRGVSGFVRQQGKFQGNVDLKI